MSCSSTERKLPEGKNLDIIESFMGPWTVPGTWHLARGRCQIIEGIHIIAPELEWFEIREVLFFDPARMARLSSQPWPWGRRRWVRKRLELKLSSFLPGRNVPKQKAERWADVLGSSNIVHRVCFSPYPTPIASLLTSPSCQENLEYRVK